MNPWVTPGARALALLAILSGCGGREPRREPPSRLDVSVFADTGRAQRLHVSLPAAGGARAATDTADGAARAEVWLVRVAPMRAMPLDEVPLPEAGPGAVDSIGPAPPGLDVDPGLKPPILLSPGRLRVPAGGPRGHVELDVRVAEDGAVSDALWAGGSRDRALVSAASECALAMRFYPALKAGRPVAVWCRQRFDFGGH